MARSDSSSSAGTAATATGGAWTAGDRRGESPTLDPKAVAGTTHQYYQARNACGAATGVSPGELNEAKGKAARFTPRRMAALNAVSGQYGDLLKGTRAGESGKVGRKLEEVQLLQDNSGAAEALVTDLGNTLTLRKAELVTCFDETWDTLKPQADAARASGSADTRAVEAFDMLERADAADHGKVADHTKGKHKAVANEKQRADDLTQQNATLEARVHELEGVVTQLRQQLVLQGGNPHNTGSTPATPAATRRKHTR